LGGKNMQINYDPIVKEYLATRDRLKSGKYVQQLLKYLPKKSTILDLGCGAGVPVDDILIKAGNFVLKSAAQVNR
jgi:16S rRNA G527 N7-methylase RsmG